MLTELFDRARRTAHMFISRLLNAHDNKWDFKVVRALLNLGARIAKSFIYFCCGFYSAYGLKSGLSSLRDAY